MVCDVNNWRAGCAALLEEETRVAGFAALLEEETRVAGCAALLVDAINRSMVAPVSPQ